MLTQLILTLVNCCLGLIFTLVPSREATTTCSRAATSAQHANASPVGSLNPPAGQPCRMTTRSFTSSSCFFLPRKQLALEQYFPVLNPHKSLLHQKFSNSRQTLMSFDPKHSHYRAFVAPTNSPWGTLTSAPYLTTHVKNLQVRNC